MIRRLAAAVAALSLLAILAAPVLAGGWAEIRIDPATTPDLPAIGVIALAVLVGGAAGFVMSWLAGRPAPREIDVSFSPTPRGADPA